MNETTKQTLSKLNEAIDQLSSEARDCTDYPEVGKCLDLAWWLAENALRIEGEGSCGHALLWKDLIRRDVKRQPCACCTHYMDLYGAGRHVQGTL